MAADLAAEIGRLAWARALAAPFLALDAARGHLLPLAVVCLGLGIGLWFSWPADPSAGVLAGAGAIAALALSLMLAPPLFRPPALMVFALAAGFLVAEGRARLVAAPVLAFRYYGPVQGRVVEIDRSGSDALRLTLDRVVLADTDPARTPARVRISLHGTQGFLTPAPGQVVLLTGHLAAPEGPAEPGGFDFRRMAFFERLGAVGYTRNPVLLLEAPGPAEAWIGRLRVSLSAVVRAHIPGEAGAFASGAITGDRSGISQATVEALRDSSLAHILAISGMNMAFLCAFVFALIRGAIACVPPVALRVDARKVSAVLSFGVALFYLMLSGANVATERAFLMITVMLGAILLDRRAISLSSAAIAGAIQLVWRPESLLAPGFQMSFAATVALIAGFRGLERLALTARWPRWTVPAFTLVASSVIGGFATAPYAAAHFNRFADYGLLANLLTVPAMGLMIMPMAALAVVLAPFGLAAVPLWVMGKGAEWILYIAHLVAGMQGAVTGIPAPAPGVLAAVTLGGLWLILWPGAARLAGLLPVVVALVIWPAGGRPDLLVASDGRLVGLMTPQGRALSLARGGGFSASNWLENDGDLAGQETAAARPGFAGPKAARRFDFAGLRAVVLTGKRGLAALPEACATADLVILAEALPRGEAAPCPVIDAALLAQSGALAFRIGPGGGIEVAPVRARSRIWSGGGVDPAALRAALPPGIAIAGQQGASPEKAGQ